MIDLAQQLEQRFPAWFRGRRRRLAVPAVRGLSRLSGLDEINAFLARSAHLTGFAFVDAALAFLDCRHVVDHVERARIPEQGRVVIVANHPLGAADALALLRLVGDVRRDVRIVANDLLGVLSGLRDLLIPLRVMGGAVGAGSLRAIHAALARDEAVIVFPAGEVARLTPRGIDDGPWRRGFLQFAARAQAPVLPVRIAGRNSAWFYGLSAIYRPLGTAMLPREMRASGTRRVEIRIGEPLVPTAGDSADTSPAMVARVRAAVAAIGTRREYRAPLQPLAHAPRVRELIAELATIDCVGETADGMRIHVGKLAADSALLHEVSRLRELTFRAVGEGTGRARDCDAYDTWYDHIIVWDARAGEIAGAYRAVRGADMLPTRGAAGFYTTTLFDYDPAFAEVMASGMELGRSFVQPRYWGTRSLDYLWYGIGAYLRRHPDVRHLFGPVSISASLPLAAREQLVGYYSRFYGDERDGKHALARSRHPFRFEREAPTFADDAGRDAAFAAMKRSLAALGARVPTLYKQYTELTEPGGTRFLAFGVDPDFAGSIDGLIVVDTTRIKPAKRARYLDAPARALVQP